MSDVQHSCNLAALPGADCGTVARNDLPSIANPTRYGLSSNLEEAIDASGRSAQSEINGEFDLMRLVKCGATFLACSVAIVTGSAAASARPSHHHRHAHIARHHVQHHHGRTAAVTKNFNFGGPASMPSYAPVDGSNAYAAVPRTRRTRHHHVDVTNAPAASFGGIGGSNALVAEARRYLGTNPTGRRSLWCGAFMDKVLRETGHKGGGNLAKGYLRYGHRVSGPRVGAIAVMGRKGGGHVGVVSGVDPNGNPIIVSGNHNHTVAESVYPRSRIIAYVEPNS
jgi:uncharacterized protein (TIGR02594 family)